MNPRRLIKFLLVGALLPGCNPQATSGEPAPANNNVPPAGNPTPTEKPKENVKPAEMPPPEDPQLAARQLNYGLALRTAAVKLVGDLPTLDEQREIQAAPNPREAYERRVAAYLADPRFAPQAIALFRNAFKMGGAINGGPSLETAPVFAARLVVEDRPFTEVVTASANTCPTWDAKKAEFVDGECKNGVPLHAGVLTDPGVQAHFSGNMAFRRVRWVQETFDCRKFPAEYTKKPTQMGGGLYTSPWPFSSISGGEKAPIDFHDTKSVVCANCHSTMNHLAPLFGNFDGKGMWQKDIQVITPINGLPKTKRSDWLPDTEDPSWRLGVAVSDLPALGKTIARDPGFAGCVATRVYDRAMSKDDPVTDLAIVPEAVIAPYRDALVKGDFRVKEVIRRAFTSDDFVRF